MTHEMTVLVASYGIFAVFALMTFESCGFWFPSEVIMPAGGVLAATGHLNFVEVVAAGAIGNVIGSLIAYALAAKFGRPLLLGPGRWVGISPHHLDMADGWFAKRGLLAVFIGRDLPVVRTYISFPAGLARVPLVPFTVLTLIGVIPWCIALTYVGYALGDNYTKVSEPIQLLAIGIAVVIAIGVVVWIVRGRRS